MPWEQILRDFAAYLQWNASDVLDKMSLAEFYLVWCGGGTHRVSHDSQAVRDKINRLRAKKGLPPMKPAAK